MSDRRGLRICFLGHATVLIELDGLRVLTDPVLRPRIGHLRRTVPDPDPEHAASIDLVLVSHAHHDHLDRGSLRRLDPAVRVLCAAPAARPISSAGLSPEILEPGEEARVGPLEVVATEAHHDGRRWPLVGGRGSVGFVLRGSRSVYFAGDTGLFPGMERLGSIDLALLPVAGWGPKLPAGHLDPDAAAEAAALIAPAVAVPIHWGTLRRIGMRAEERAEAPARRFLAALAERAPAVAGELVEPGDWLDLGEAEPAA